MERAGNGIATRPQIVTKRGAMSCITERETVRGRWLVPDYFDVPLEQYCEGWLTGVRLAAEYMAARERGGTGAHLHGVVEAAYVVLAECRGQGSLKRPSKQGAAHAFTSVLESFLGAAAQRFDWQRYIDLKISDHHRDQALLGELKTRRGRDFARRMEIAQAAAARKRKALGSN